MDRLARHPYLEDSPCDRGREVERDHSTIVAPEDFGGKRAGNLLAHWVTTEMNAGTDRDADVGDSNTAIREGARRPRGDALAGPAPAGMNQRSRSAVRRDERDRSAVRRGDRNPRIAGPHQESIRLARNLGGLYDARAVHLPHAHRPLLGNPEDVGQPGTVLQDGFALVSDFQSEVEGGIGPLAHASDPARHPEPDARRQMIRGWAPKGKIVSVPRIRHGAQRAWFRVLAQAACASVLIVAGCAGVPKLRSGEEAKARFLAAYAAPDGPVRGVASVSLSRPGERRGGARVRWASSGDSLALIGYVGPSRVLDAALLRDSLYVGLRPWRTAVSGPVSGQEGLDARLLRFAVEPWDFGAAWLRGEVERAAFEPSAEGWICRGAFPVAATPGADPAANVPFRFALEVTSKGEPGRFTFRREGETREILSIRYGSKRRFAAGSIPRWIEWSFSGTVIRLELEELAPVDPTKLRCAPPPPADWTTLRLDEPRGRSLVRWLVGLSEEGAGR